MCELMVFLSATTQDVLLSNGGKSSPLSASGEADKPGPNTEEAGGLLVLAGPQLLLITIA